MKGNRILVVAAHPDDEVLGCGGTIAKHVAAGDRVEVIILAEGLTSRPARRDREAQREELSALARAAQAANEALGVSSLSLHELPDNRMDSVPRLDIIKLVEAHIDRIQPAIVYTHHGGDVNIDHRRVHEAVVTSCRPVPGHPVRSLLFFEVPSSTEWQPPASAPAFLPNWYVDISSTLEQKAKALAAYSSEMRPWPHARSTEAIMHRDRWRGATIGSEAAEAFMVGRVHA